MNPIHEHRIAGRPAAVNEDGSAAGGVESADGRERVGAERFSFGDNRRMTNEPVEPRDPLESLRAVCLALPETSERLSHGEPAWFVRGRKTFVTYADHHHDDRLAFWCAAPPGVQEALAGSDPERYFRPPYVGHRGWIGVRLDLEAPPDWDELREIVVDAYRTVAPRTLVARLGGEAE